MPLQPNILATNKYMHIHDLHCSKFVSTQVGSGLEMSGVEFLWKMLQWYRRECLPFGFNRDKYTVVSCSSSHMSILDEIQLL